MIVNLDFNLDAKQMIRDALTKQMNFRKSFKEGGGGHFQSKFLKQGSKESLGGKIAT